MSIKTLKANLHKAHRDRETITVGGGTFEPHEIRQALEDIQWLVHTAETLAGHVAHYAAMPHAHSNAHKHVAEAHAILAKFKD